MESHQTGTKRSSAEANSLQVQDALTNSEEGENVKTKQMKTEKHPVEIRKIVAKIISFLNDVDSIKLARQINKTWSAEGAKILITKCYLQLPSLEWNEEPSSMSKKMDEFKAFLSNKENALSLISKITIGEGRHVELWQSLGVLGQQITSLKLKNVYEADKVLGNLWDLLPNLKYLIPDIMDSDNMMGVIKVLTTKMSKTKKKDKRQLILSKFYWTPDCAAELECLEQFSNCKNIMIENLELILWVVFKRIKNVRARVLSLLSKLLSTSQHTLKKLSLSFCEMYLYLLEFPKLSQLTFLDLHFYSPIFVGRNPFQYGFSPSFRFSEKIPNVEQIVILTAMGGPGHGAIFVQTLFDKNMAASSVKRLTYSDTISDSTIAHLFQIFPNTEDLEVKRTECTLRMFRPLWEHGQKLKKLCISFYLDELVGDATDLFFTGFSPETVDRIKNHPEEFAQYSFEQLDKLRVNPSILDLKELKVLAIHFDGLKCLTKKVFTITGEYAFKFMPKDVQIVLKAEDCSKHGCFKNSFEQVSKLPNVSIQLKVFGF